MNLNKEEILKLVDDGYILMNKHPEEELYILNYSKTAQFEQLWNEYTLMCRGLVVDKDFNVVARPFNKFFNLEEHEDADIPKGMKFEAYEKMDGSLGIAFNYNGSWRMATRGSFTSDQAIKAAEMINDNVDYVHGAAMFDPKYTYLFEIIYPENRIVVDYGKEEKLVLLGVVNTETGEEMSWKNMVNNYGMFFEVVKKHYGLENYDQLYKLKELERENSEGFVLRFENGFRVKVKFAEYVRLHRILTNVSNRSIWDALRSGTGLDDIINNVPDEFYDWVKETKRDFETRYMEIENKALKRFWNVYYVDGKRERKDFAEEVKWNKYSGILFKLYDGKDNYSDQIWKMLRPKYSKPFADDEENV